MMLNHRQDVEETGHLHYKLDRILQGAQHIHLATLEGQGAWHLRGLDCMETEKMVSSQLD